MLRILMVLVSDRCKVHGAVEEHLDGSRELKHLKKLERLARGDGNPIPRLF